MIALFFLSCIPLSRELPPKRLLRVQRPCSDLVHFESEEVQGIYVQSKPVPFISPEQSVGVALMERVVLSTGKKELFYSDVPHGADAYGGNADLYRNCKLETSDIEVEPINGTVDSNHCLS